LLGFPNGFHLHGLDLVIERDVDSRRLRLHAKEVECGGGDEQPTREAIWLLETHRKRHEECNDGTNPNHHEQGLPVLNHAIHDLKRTDELAVAEVFQPWHRNDSKSEQEAGDQPAQRRRHEHYEGKELHIASTYQAERRWTSPIKAT
jgi:hypothetical protein